jgi:histone-lysine N-methyltransferase SUV39H
MIERARTASTAVAESKIRAEFVRELQNIRGPKPVQLVNTLDTTTPPLSFQFIQDYIYREGVYPPNPDAMIGCKSCRPNMGGNCGCEYTKLCECLEYGEVDYKKLTVEEAEACKAAEARGDTTLGFSKRFPYSKGTGYLVQAYINSGFPIYECNAKCACGPICKSRVVQKGRHVGLQIFKTRNRGWGNISSFSSLIIHKLTFLGLRSSEALMTGEFIDTYRGEVITDEEARKREEEGDKDKDSYLFSLDKHSVPDAYVVDGQYFGGPSRFINHSCDPNCGIYVVSYDKNNTYLYELAFFALRQIAAGEELTFDYCAGMAEQDVEANVDADSIPCKCGSAQCRKWLWK